MRRRKRLLVVSGLLVTVGVAAGIAWATIPNNGVITGCYLKAGGGLRVIDETVTANCKSNETKLQWNVQGAKGEPGAKGEDGADGADGSDGTRISRRHNRQRRGRLGHAHGDGRRSRIEPHLGERSDP
jgi:hypothetical protein